MNYTEEWRKRVRKAIKAKEYTHYRLAKETGLRVSTVDTAVNGSGEVYYSTAMRINSALGVTA